MHQTWYLLNLPAAAVPESFQPGMPFTERAQRCAHNTASRHASSIPAQFQYMHMSVSGCCSRGECSQGRRVCAGRQGYQVRVGDSPQAGEAPRRGCGAVRRAARMALRLALVRCMLSASRLSYHQRRSAANKAAAPTELRPGAERAQQGVLPRRASTAGNLWALWSAVRAWRRILCSLKVCADGSTPATRARA